jgi:hypothetical protein
MISANRLWKESGSNLPFKDWLEREKAKGEFIPNIQAQEEFNNADGDDEPQAPQGNPLKGKLETGSIIGKNLLIIGALAIGVYFIYKTYYKKDA